MSHPVIVVLLKQRGREAVTYPGDLLSDGAGHFLIRAEWDRAALHLGYVTFEPGDVFFEHYYRERWYTVFELRGEGGRLKGWYCNIARPARFDGETVTSEDLELDLFVSPDRQTLLRLDEDDFAGLGLDVSEPQAYAVSLSALAELERLATAGAPPFDRL